MDLHCPDALRGIAAKGNCIQGRGGTYQSSDLRPDTVVKIIDKVYILDAKYYKYGITRNPKHLPATDSIQKQITCGEYVEKKELAHKNKIFNAFIMPFQSLTDEPYQFVAVGTADWKIYGPDTANHEYILGILVDTTHLLRTYTKHNFSEIERLCNEEGLINGMEFNRRVPGGYGGVFGPFFVCGLTGDDFGSLTPEQIEVYKKAFGKAEILIGAQGNEPITMKVQAKSKSTPGQDRGPSKPTPGQDR